MNPSGGKTWTGAMDADLRRLHAAGNGPTAIAAKMGRGRNSVIGRMHRMGLKCSPEVASKARRDAWRKKGAKPKAAEWAPEEIATLAQLVARGLSAGQVASALKRSRNSVLTRVWRDGLRFRGGKNNNPTGMTVTRLRALRDGTASRPALPPRVALPLAAPVEAPVSIADLGSRQCRYIGERPALVTLDTAIYCGAPTDGGSWCPAHRARVFVAR